MKKSYIIKHLAGTSFFFIILFVSAGRLNYLQGIVYVCLGLAMSALNYTVLKPDDELLNERATPGEGSKNWDKAILGLSFIITIAMFVIAGLDSGRYRWSPDFHPSLFPAGIFLTASGQIIFLVAQKQNKFFSSTVRIQIEREHKVCDSGLYKIVRHPAYSGAIIQSAGFPLLFGSLWSIIPAGMLIVLHSIRTYLEDKTLLKELKGYSEYAGKTRYRIIPYIW